MGPPAHKPKSITDISGFKLFSKNGVERLAIHEPQVEPQPQQPQLQSFDKENTAMSGVERNDNDGDLPPAGCPIIGINNMGMES